MEIARELEIGNEMELERDRWREREADIAEVVKIEI
jgi:hypothetical protein